jgi:hypothetical protein
MNTDEFNLVAMLRDTVLVLEQRGNTMDAMRVDAAAAEIGHLRAENARLTRERDRLAAAVRQADEFLEGTVAYGLDRQEKWEIRKAFRRALVGLDPAPVGERRDDS